VADESPKQSFWTTLPGILTGMAAVLTAAGGIILGLHQSGNLGSKEAHRETPSAVTERAAEAPPATGAANAQVDGLSAKIAEKSSTEKSAAAPVSSTDVVISETDGTTLAVYLENLNFAGNGRGVQLTTGQTIDFGKIKTIDVSGDESRSNYKIALTSGEVLTGNADYPGGAIMGQNRLGSVYAPLKKIRRITFPN